MRGKQSWRSSLVIFGGKEALYDLLLPRYDFDIPFQTTNTSPGSSRVDEPDMS